MSLVHLFPTVCIKNYLLIAFICTGSEILPDRWSLDHIPFLTIEMSLWQKLDLRGRLRFNLYSVGYQPGPKIWPLET